MAKTDMVADVAELDGTLYWALKTQGVSAEFAGRDMMRVFCNNLVDMTFPKSRKIGVEHIDNDLNKVFAVLDSPEVVGYFNAAFGDGTYTKGGKLKGKKRQAEMKRRVPGAVFNWQGNQGHMKGWHSRYRKRGKVWKKSSAATRRGPWTFGDEMYIPRTAFNRYRRTVLKSIGKVKAGWADAAAYFAKVTGGRLIMPAFVRKQQDKRGTFYDGFDDGEGFGTATNLIPYASRMTRYFLKAAELRTDEYSRKATKRQIEKIVERFNAITGKPPAVQVVRP